MSDEEDKKDPGRTIFVKNINSDVDGIMSRIVPDTAKANHSTVVKDVEQEPVVEDSVEDTNIVHNVRSEEIVQEKMETSSVSDTVEPVDNREVVRVAYESFDGCVPCVELRNTLEAVKEKVAGDINLVITPIDVRLEKNDNGASPSPGFVPRWFAMSDKKASRQHVGFKKDTGDDDIVSEIMSVLEGD